MQKLVLLTGATGFVGRQVLNALAEKNISVRLVVRDGSDIPQDVYPRIDRVIKTSDIFTESINWWTNACEGVDTIIHVAWYAEPGKYLQSAINLDCLTGTLFLAKGAALAGVRRFIGIGTCAEYDLSVGDITVDTPLQPLTPYAGTKAAAFIALSQWLPQQNIEFAWCRLFYLYGEGEDERRLAPYLRSKLETGETAELTNGDQIRDFLDVKDAGQMIVKTVLSDEKGAVNICSGIAITVRQFAEQIADEYGRRDLLKFGVRPDNPFDPPRVVGVKHEV